MENIINNKFQIPLKSTLIFLRRGLKDHPEYIKPFIQHYMEYYQYLTKDIIDLIVWIIASLTPQQIEICIPFIEQVFDNGFIDDISIFEILEKLSQKENISQNFLDLLKKFLVGIILTERLDYIKDNVEWKKFYDDPERNENKSNLYNYYSKYPILEFSDTNFRFYFKEKIKPLLERLPNVFSVQIFEEIIKMYFHDKEIFSNDTTDFLLLNRWIPEHLNALYIAMENEQEREIKKIKGLKSQNNTLIFCALNLCEKTGDFSKIEDFLSNSTNYPNYNLHKIIFRLIEEHFSSFKEESKKKISYIIHNDLMLDQPEIIRKDWIKYYSKALPSLFNEKIQSKQQFEESNVQNTPSNIFGEEYSLVNLTHINLDNLTTSEIIDKILELQSNDIKHNVRYEFYSYFSKIIGEHTEKWIPIYEAIFKGNFNRFDSLFLECLLDAIIMIYDKKEKVPNNLISLLIEKINPMCKIFRMLNRKERESLTIKLLKIVDTTTDFSLLNDLENKIANLFFLLINEQESVEIDSNPIKDQLFQPTIIWEQPYQTLLIKYYIHFIAIKKSDLKKDIINDIENLSKTLKTRVFTKDIALISRFNGLYYINKELANDVLKKILIEKHYNKKELIILYFFFFRNRIYINILDEMRIILKELLLKYLVLIEREKLELEIISRPIETISTYCRLLYFEGYETLTNTLFNQIFNSNLEILANIEWEFWNSTKDEKYLEKYKKKIIEFWEYRISQIEKIPFRKNEVNWFLLLLKDRGRKFPQQEIIDILKVVIQKNSYIDFTFLDDLLKYLEFLSTNDPENSIQFLYKLIPNFKNYDYIDFQRVEPLIKNVCKNSIENNQSTKRIIRILINELIESGHQYMKDIYELTF